MSRQRRRTAASALAVAVLVAGLALPASAQAAESVPEATSTSVAPVPVVAPDPVEVPGVPSTDPVPPVEVPPVEVPPVEPEPQPSTEPEPEPEPSTEPEVPGVPDTDPEPPVVEVPGVPATPTNPEPTTPSNPGGGSTGGGSTGGGSTGGGSTGGGSTGGGSTGGGSTGGGSTGGGSTGGGSTGGGSTGGGSGSSSGTSGGGSGGTTGGTATTEAGSTAPRASAPGRTLLSTSAADPAAAPLPAADGQSVTEATAPAVSVFLTRDAGVDPAALTVDLARFYGVGIAFAGFQREENSTATLRAPSGMETALTVENRQDGETTSTASASVPTAALSSIGTYTVAVTGDRGSAAETTFALAASTAPGVLVEPREASSAEASAPRGAVWGFGPVESVSVAAFTTAGVRADLAAGALSVRVDALGWSDLALGDAIVKEPTAAVYCIVAVGSVSKRTAAVTVAYPEGDSAATVPEAAQVCGIAITTAKAGLVPPTTASTGGLSAGVGLTIGAGVLVALLIAGLVTAVVLRRRRENDDLLIGGPLPHTTEE